MSNPQRPMDKHVPASMMISGLFEVELNRTIENLKQEIAHLNEIMQLQGLQLQEQGLQLQEQSQLVAELQETRVYPHFFPDSPSVDASIKSESPVHEKPIMGGESPPHLSHGASGGQSVVNRKTKSGEEAQASKRPKNDENPTPSPSESIANLKQQIAHLNEVMESQGLQLQEQGLQLQEQSQFIAVLLQETRVDPRFFPSSPSTGALVGSESVYEEPITGGESPPPLHHGASEERSFVNGKAKSGEGVLASKQPKNDSPASSPGESSSSELAGKERQSGSRN